MVEESAASTDPAAATPAVEKSDNDAKIIQQVEVSIEVKVLYFDALKNIFSSEYTDFHTLRRGPQ